MPPTKRILPLLLIVIVLLGHLALRAHEPGAVPVFVDEYNHIRRAADAYDFDYNPMQTSHGKLLFYYWVGLFGPDQGQAALVVSRLANVLASLVTCAAAGAVARRLFGPRALLPAMAFYALVPFAVFFDRTALADPLAGALSTLAAWGSLLIVRRATRRRGLVVGALVTAAVLAKLTTGFVIGLPVLAAALLGDVPLPRWNQAAIRGWLSALWRRYRPAWIAAAAVFGAAWIVVLGLAAQSFLAGNDTPVIDGHLVQQEATTDNLLVEKWHNVEERAERLIAAPLAIGMVALGVVLLWRMPRQGLYALAWLLAIWFPNLAFADDVQSRYLMAGVGALAALFGGEMVAAGDALADLVTRRPDPAAVARARRSATGALAGIILLVWAVGFALPFDVNASTDPAALDLPWRDSHDYFNYIYNTWGIRESLHWAETHGERLDGQVPLVGVLNHCGPVNIYVTADMDWTCLDRWGFPGSRMPPDVSRWGPVMAAAERDPFVYVVSEYPDIVPPGDPPTGGPLRWDLQYTFTRPQGGLTIALWRVTAVQQ